MKCNNATKTKGLWSRRFETELLAWEPQFQLFFSACQSPPIISTLSRALGGKVLPIDCGLDDRSVPVLSGAATMHVYGGVRWLYVRLLLVVHAISEGISLLWKMVILWPGNRSWKVVFSAYSSFPHLFFATKCSGQLIPDTVLSFSSVFAGANPSLNWWGRIQL